MRDGFEIARVLGIPIRIHWSWFPVVALITWSLAAGYFPGRLPGATLRLLWLYGLGATVLLFASVLLHELAHAVVARRAGLPVGGITLHVFGGVAQLEREPSSPRTEFTMAAAGPLTSYAIAALCWLALRAWPAAEAGEAILAYLGAVNVVVATFNLVPGFPLDGGRLLRSALWAWRGDLAWATRVASHAGSGFAVFLIVVGALRFVAGETVGGAWLVLIGLFLRQAARASFGELVARRSLEHVPVADAMARDVVVVPATASVEHLVDAFFWRHHVTSFPVVAGPAGRDGVVGIVTIHEVKALPAERWRDTTVRDVMVPMREDLAVTPGTSCWDALGLLSRNGVGRLLVQEGARLVGYLSLRDVLHLLALQTAGGVGAGRERHGPAVPRAVPPMGRAA